MTDSNLPAAFRNASRSDTLNLDVSPTKSRVMSKLLSGGTPTGAAVEADVDGGATTGADGALLGIGPHEPHAYPLADLKTGKNEQVSEQSIVPLLPILIVYPKPLHRSALLLVLHGRPNTSNNVAKRLPWL